MIKEGREELRRIAEKLVENNRGILAIDETPKSIERKFSAVGIENTEENRRRYRELLITPPLEISKYLGGVILNEETFFQKGSDGTSFIDSLNQRQILPGIKLDKGLLALKNSEQEKVSTGLGDLSERCKRYKTGGATFAKWRSVFTISADLPSEECIYENCNTLSEYALICQRNGLVPVIEPEILFTGCYESEKSEVVTASVISCLFYHLNRKGVFIPGILLKLGFVTAGSENPRQSLDEVACGTIESFMRSIPPAVPGVVFLSGGHPEDVSVDYLKAVNKMRIKRKAPWIISFSFGRALQDSVLRHWNNEDSKKKEAQEKLLERASLCSQALRN
ncbi:fructose-bisphosphate aldolase, class I [Nematocida sp. AWRm80]|nr:fructose-bisphosphate aldolase, class I [Nematocida sp. AWRm80]